MFHLKSLCGNKLADCGCVSGIMEKSIRKTGRKGRGKMNVFTDFMAIFPRLCYTVTNVRKGEISDACKGRRGMGLCGRHDKS